MKIYHYQVVVVVVVCLLFAEYCPRHWRNWLEVPVAKLLFFWSILCNFSENMIKCRVGPLNSPRYIFIDMSLTSCNLIRNFKSKTKYKRSTIKECFHCLAPFQRNSTCCLSFFLCFFLQKIKISYQNTPVELKFIMDVL